MPTYEYKCNACKHQFEVFQSIKDSPKRKCPECGKSALERLIGTGGAIIFKGSGFYQTDYRSESYKKGAEAEKPAPTESSSSKTEPKAESKPAEAKSETKMESKPALETSSKTKTESKDKKSKSKA
jgi:putative FmdB family regulatory protein